MKTRGIIALVLSIASLLLVGCGNDKFRITTPSPSHSIQTATVPSTNTFVPLPTRTAVLPYTDFDQFNRNCPHFEKNFQTGFLSSGYLILNKITGTYSGVILTLSSRDPSPRISSLPNREMWISLTGKWLALFDDNSLKILSLDGKSHLSIPWKSQWVSVQSWLDADHMVLQYDNKPKVDILDVTTGYIQTISPYLSDVYVYEDWEYRLPVWKLVPDPTLSRYVYMRNVGENIPALVIVDIASQKTLGEWRRFTPGEGDIPPVWSPDEQWLAVLGNDNFTFANEQIYHPDEEATHMELVLINHEGSLTEWVNIEVPSEQTPSFNREMKWSPDGRYLAFFKDSLYLLDMKTKTISNLCVSNPIHVYWSPDSTQIVTERDGFPPIVTNIEKNISMQITDDSNIQVIGWMREP